MAKLFDKPVVLEEPKISAGKQLFNLPDSVCRELFATADEAMKYTFPEAGKGYSVAILTSSGTVYTGASYNSDTYTLTMHAEAVALAHAAQHGETNIVAITGPNCHICKQLIWESSLRSGIDTLVLIEEYGSIQKIPMVT